MSNVIVQNVVLPPDQFGCQDGLAIYAVADPSTTTKVTMSAVQVTNYDKNGITCDDIGTTCTITGSTVTGGGCISTTAQNGIQGYDADLWLSRPTMSRRTATPEPRSSQPHPPLRRCFVDRHHSHGEHR